MRSRPMTGAGSAWHSSGLVAACDLADLLPPMRAYCDRSWPDDANAPVGELSILAAQP